MSIGKNDRTMLVLEKHNGTKNKHFAIKNITKPKRDFGRPNKSLTYTEIGSILLTYILTGKAKDKK